jgi:hypothetical protein
MELKTELLNNKEFVEAFNLLYKNDSKPEDEDGWDEDEYDFDLSELPQLSPDTMALGIIEDGTIKNVTQWFKCREFFNDIILYNRYGFDYTTQYNIYGLYLHTVVPIDLDNTVLLVKLEVNSIQVEDVISSVRKRLGLIDSVFNTKSTLTLVEKDRMLVIHYDKEWIKNSVTFSFFTREIRWAILVGSGKYPSDDIDTCNLRSREIDCFGSFKEGGSLNFYKNNITIEKVTKALRDGISEEYEKARLSENRTHSLGIGWYLNGNGYIDSVY